MIQIDYILHEGHLDNVIKTVMKCCSKFIWATAFRKRCRYRNNRSWCLKIELWSYSPHSNTNIINFSFLFFGAIYFSLLSYLKQLSRYSQRGHKVLDFFASLPFCLVAFLWFCLLCTQQDGIPWMVFPYISLKSHKVIFLDNQRFHNKLGKKFSPEESYACLFSLSCQITCVL